MYHAGVHVGLDSGDVDLVVAELNDGAVEGERLAPEAGRIVGDEPKPAEALQKPGDGTLAVGQDLDTRPDGNSSQRRCWPHGGRQLSWWCHGRCHRMANVGADGRWRHRGGILR